MLKFGEEKKKNNKWQKPYRLFLQTILPTKHVEVNKYIIKMSKENEEGNKPM